MSTRVKIKVAALIDRVEAKKQETVNVLGSLREIQAARSELVRERQRQALEKALRGDLDCRGRSGLGEIPLMKANRRMRPWTPDEDAILLDPPPELRHQRSRRGGHLGARNHRAIADRLGRTADGVSDRLRVLRGQR